MNLATGVILSWFCREFEINYRLSFHCSLLAARDRKKILNLKNQVRYKGRGEGGFHERFVTKISLKLVTQW